MAESPLEIAAYRILLRGHYMSPHPQEPPSVPEETNRVARAAFPNGLLCLHIADELGSIYTDHQFTALFPRRGKHAEAPGRLALPTVLQFLEGLSDRQAADAVRGRIDWKYALGVLSRILGHDGARMCSQ
jgi:transposase